MGEKGSFADTGKLWSLGLVRCTGYSSLMQHIENHFDLPQRYHDALPERIRAYLRSRGVTDQCMDEFLIGWNGWRITMPVMNRDRRFSFFRLAKDPEDTSDFPKMLATPGSHAVLYGWETLYARPNAVIICEGEFDRLVLESNGFPAVTSTAGAGTFRPEWAEAVAQIPRVYICMDRDEPGRKGALQIARMIPKARLIELPEEVGDGGDITDYFVRLGKSRQEFLELVRHSQTVPPENLPVQEVARRRFVETHMEVERLKQCVSLDLVVGRVVPLRRSGKHLIGKCPFHPDKNPSFVVYAQNQHFYCFGCRAHGDVIDFLVRSEHVSFPQALVRLRELAAELSTGHERAA